MIRYNPKSWFALIFHRYSRETFSKVFPSLIFMTIYATAIWYLSEIIDFMHPKSTTEIHSLLGIVLGLFLVFRTNTAYDRWWEGRIIWGELVNTSRNFALKLNAIVARSETQKRAVFSDMIGNYASALKDHLRNRKNLESLKGFTEKQKEQFNGWEHPLNFIGTIIYDNLNELFERKAISDAQYFILDKEAKMLTEALGKCERVRNTPIPYAYSMYMKKFIFIYVLTLPLGIVNTFSYWMIPIVLLVFYVLFTIEIIAEEIEDPFGEDENDLPTDDIAANIRKNVDEILLSSTPQSNSLGAGSSEE